MTPPPGRGVGPAGDQARDQPDVQPDDQPDVQPDDQPDDEAPEGDTWARGLWAVAVVVGLAAAWGQLVRPLASPVPSPVMTLIEAGADGGRVATARAYQDQLIVLRLIATAVVLSSAALLSAPPLRRRLDGLMRILDDGRARRARPSLAPLVAGGAAMAAWAAADLLLLPVAFVAWQRSAAVGLSVQTFGETVRDRLIVLGPECVGVGLTIAFVAWMAQRNRPGWIPAAGLVVGTATVAVIFAGPLVLEPLLLNFTPLEHGSLREEILRLSRASLGDEVDEVLVADASRRTTASNAYVSGLAGTRRMVLYDTLIADAPPQEVLAVVAHELSHRANGDVPRTALSALALPTLVIAIVVKVLGPRLRHDSAQIRVGWAPSLVAAALIASLVSAPLVNWASRRAESAADAGAIDLIDDPRSYAQMMIGLADRNLSDPDPAGWVVALWYSHPPVAERATRALTTE